MKDEIKNSKVDTTDLNHTLNAHTFIKAWPSFSLPVLLRCTDNNNYVVKSAKIQRGSKFQDIGKSVFSEQIVGRIGHLLGAPVAEINLVNIPEELRNIEPKIAHMSAGLAHATKHIENVSERLALTYCNQNQNQIRFAYLAVLYSWIGASDHQLIYKNVEPNVVYSVDHGHFFPSGPNWTEQSLLTASSPLIDPWFDACSFNNHDFIKPHESLNKISNTDITNIVEIPPDSWNISDNERTAVTNYLINRKDQMLEILNDKIQGK